MKSISDRIYNIRNGVRNLWYWKKIIWKDRWYDYIFILSLLQHKLRQTEHMTRHRGNHVNNIDDADKMKVAVNLLDRLLEDDYFERATKSIYEDYGDPEFNWEDCDDITLKKLNIHHNKIQTEEDQADFNRRFKEASFRQARSKQGDIDYLFNHIARYLQTWWD